MAVDKILEIDLSQLTPSMLDKIDKQLEKVSNFFNEERGEANQRLSKQLLLSKSQKEEGLRKVFGRQTFSNLLKVGTNPVGFVTSSVTKLIPFIGTALIVTGVIAAFIAKVDAFQKKFIDNVDDRISLFRTKEQQALVQAGLQQLIITSQSGSTEPRDAYNTFQEFNTNQQRIETDFQIRNTSGVT